MLLCDIGNSYIHFYQNGKVWKESPDKMGAPLRDSKVYYISVNPSSAKRLLALAPHAHNLAPYMTLDSAYRGLGVDRIAACKGVNDGVVVDAGSAITVDVMQSGVHLGGYIMPGIATFGAMFKGISPVLAEDFNLSVELAAFPQNTKDALSYGAIKAIVLMIQHSCKNKRLFFTGGDGKFLARFFESAVYDNSIVFKGMLKTLQELKERR